MLIRSIIVRGGGTFITMPNADGSPDTEYAFKPNAKGDHVASVKDLAHMIRLLSITEGFAFYEAEPGDSKAANTPTPANETQTIADEAAEKLDAKPEPRRGRPPKPAPVDDPLAPLQAITGA